MSSIEITLKDDMLLTTTMGNHDLTIEVPESIGGMDRTMKPPQLFLASIASCTAIYVAEYCKTSGIDVKGLKVRMDYEKLDNPIHLSNFKMKISLPSVSEDRKSAVLRAAEHCLVHESLKNFKGITFELETKPI